MKPAGEDEPLELVPDQRLARSSTASKAAQTRGRPGPERAFLVSVSFSGLVRGGRASAAPPGPRSAAAQARDASRLRAAVERETETEAPGLATPAAPTAAAVESETVGGRLAEADDGAALSEFRELVLSAGGAIVGHLTQRRPRPDPATLLGRGKVEELAGATALAEADLILFDYDLSPTQLRNLEDALSCPVLDRTQLILDIFARHARTREGQLQVELAQLEYMLPRLTGRGRAMSQLGGGIGTRGPGETQLETDRRRIGRRLVQLRRELDQVRRVRRQQRQRRETAPVPTVALVGYTNAGKSTLFNRLTDAGVFASAQMFATLDPKLRAILLPSRRKVLLSDTVGFIRDLPHTLVTSFRATLEEVEKAEVLLHVQDAAHPQAAEHKAEVEKVLGELGVLEKPTIEVWNKSDLLSDPLAWENPESRDRLRAGGVAVSALRGDGMAELLAALDRALVADPVEERWLVVPQASGEVLASLERGAVIEERKFEGERVRLRVAGARSLLGRHRRYWEAS